METVEAGAPPSRGAPSTRSAMVRQFLRLYLAVILPVIVIVLLAGWVSDEIITKRNFVEQIRAGTTMRFEWVRERLSSEPIDAWKAQIDAARRLYPAGLELEDETSFFASIHPDDPEKQHFDRGDVAFAPAPSVEGKSGAARSYPMTVSFQRVPNTTLVMSTRLSFASSNALLTYLYYLLFAVCAAAPILWFWFRPFWQDLERLGRVTEQIGSGDFSVHASPVRSSTIKPFAAAIDQMSLRIHELIDAQKRLTNSVAHELTTPLTQLVFALEMLKDPRDADQTRRLIEGMTEDLNELESLVAELLEYARLEHGAVFEPETVDLGLLMQRALESLQHRPATDKSVVLRLPADEMAPQVRCDAHQMHRAVLNLLRNAMRYARSRVALSADRVDGRVCIHVDDDGPGIPSAERARLYEPFARVDASRTRETGGHGLGLAIVQQVAKLHGGTSWIEASPLGGARVTIAW